jgi:hypothetical protein
LRLTGGVDAQSFAHHFFHRDAADQVVTYLRDAAVGAATATRQDKLAAASKHLAGLERARNPATRAPFRNSRK